MFILKNFSIILFNLKGFRRSKKIGSNRGYLSSITNASEQIDACKEKEVVLPIAQIQDLNLDKETLKVSLKYHSLRASFSCSKQAVSDYLINSAIVSAMEITDKKGTSAGDSLLVYDGVMLLKAEYEYNKLPEVHRKKIESIEELNKPFKLIESAMKLGL